MIPRLATRLVSPALWFPALAILVGGPLLLFDGYLILLDYPAGPHLERPTLFPLPSSSDIGNTTPLVAIQWLARRIHTYLPDKLFLVLPIILGGLGVYRFARRRLDLGVWPGLFGGTLFVFNPFVLDRYLSGHVHFLIAYSLLPWALHPLEEATRQPSGRAAAKAGLWVLALAAIDLHIAGVYGILAVATVLAAATSRRFLYACGAIGIAVAGSAYWLLPSLYAPPGQGVGTADLEAYASNPRGFGVLPTLAAMYGFWREEFPGPAERMPLLYLLLIPILGLVVLGLVRLWMPGPHRRFAAVLSISAVAFLALAAGISFPPTAGVFRWLYENVFVFRIYREPQKLLAPVVLAYALFGAAGLRALPLRRPALSVAASAVSVVTVLAYGFPMLWGFSGEVRLSGYPEGWAAAERVMRDHGEGRAIAFPPDLYGLWSFTERRIVAHPAQGFFAEQVLIDREAGFPTVPEQSSDPFTVYVRRFLAERDRIRHLGHLLAPLGVRYVLSFDEGGLYYAFLSEQRDLITLHESPGVTLYENTAWQAGPRGLAHGEPITEPGRVFGTGLERAALHTLFEAPPLRPRASSSFPPLAYRLPIWPTSPDLGGSPFVLTTHRCSDGWVMGTTTARCHLGVAAAFDTSEEDRVMWRPVAGARLMGLGVTVLTLFGAAAYLWRRRKGVPS